MRATTSGWEIVWPQPIGSGALSQASSRSSSGTKRSRGTAATASRTRSSATARRSSFTSPSAPPDHVPHASAAPAVRQLGQRALGVAGLDVDAAHRGRVDGHGEALLQRLERGLLDAVVRGQPDDGQLVDPALAQQLGQARAVEAGVALGAGVLALVDDHVDGGRVQVRVQLRPVGVLHAVHRPDAALRR